MKYTCLIILSLLIVACTTTPEKLIIEGSNSDPIESLKLLEKSIIYDTTFYSYSDTTFVHKGVSITITIDYNSILTITDTVNYQDSIIVRTKQTYNQSISIKSDDFQTSFSINSLNLTHLNPKYLPSFKYLNIEEINGYHLVTSRADKLLLLFNASNELKISENTELISKWNNSYLFQNLIINFNSNKIIYQPDIERVVKIKNPFLQSPFSINDSTVLLFYFGSDPISSTQSLSICSYNGKNIKFIAKSEVLYHSILHTKKRT